MDGLPTAMSTGSGSKRPNFSVSDVVERVLLEQNSHLLSNELYRNWLLALNRFATADPNSGYLL